MDNPPPPNPPAIPHWSRQRLINQARNLRLEASLYGPITNLLTDLFPRTAHFMVKPQALMREPLHDGEIEELAYDEDPGSGEDEGSGEDTDTGDMSSEEAASINESEADDWAEDEQVVAELDTSFDSYGNPAGKIKYIPDFMITKSGQGIHSDRLLSMVEVKRNVINYTLALMTVRVYAERIVQYTRDRLAQPFFIFLIRGDIVRVFNVDANFTSEERREMLRLPDNMYGIDDEQFVNDLWNIATTHWNLEEVQDDQDDEE